MPPSPALAHPRVTDAFAPLVEHLAYEFEVDRQEDRVVRVKSLLAEAGPTLQQALAAAGASQAEVQLLDLHGMRAREAREALATCTEPVCVVWFGKGTGVLREVFLEFLAETPSLVLVDMSGETSERPQEAMGVTLQRGLHDRLLTALQPQAAQAAKPAQATKPQPTPSEPAPGLWSVLWGFLRWFLVLFGATRAPGATPPKGPKKQQKPQKPQKRR